MCVAAKASGSKGEETPRRGQKRDVGVVKVCRAALLVVSGTNMGCGGTQEKAQLFLKLSHRPCNSEQHLA